MIIFDRIFFSSEIQDAGFLPTRDFRDETVLLLLRNSLYPSRPLHTHWLYKILFHSWYWANVHRLLFLAWKPGIQLWVAKRRTPWLTLSRLPTCQASSVHTCSPAPLPISSSRWEMGPVTQTITKHSRNLFELWFCFKFMVLVLFK